MATVNKSAVDGKFVSDEHVKASPNTTYTTEAKPSDPGEVSDGYHTFNELYAHRAELIIALLKQNYGKAWRAKKHEDDTMFDGFFVVGLKLPEGDVTYHLQEKYWDRLEGMITHEKAEHFDGHTSDDVLQRLSEWSKKL